MCSSDLMTLISPEMRSYFRDVTDHIRGVEEKVDALREVLAFAFETSLLMGQTQSNTVAKKLASWAAILAVPTALAGIYGMNFEVMPELKWRYGYFVVLGLMLTFCLFLFVRFKRAKWL